MKKVFQNKGFSVGKMLASYCKIQKIQRSEVARGLKRNYRTVQGHEKQMSVQTAVLWEYCHVLECNFFQVLANCLPEAFVTPTNLEGLPPSLRLSAADVEAARVQEVLDLRQELLLLRHENQLLKDLFTRR